MSHQKRAAHGHAKALAARQLPGLTVPDGDGNSPASTPPVGGGTSSPNSPPANTPSSTPQAPAPPPPAQGVTQTITSTSTQQRPSTTVPVVVVVSTTTTPRTTASRTTSSTSSTLQLPSVSTHFVVNSVSASSNSSGMLAAASSSPTSDGGASTGTIIGAVAGALVGVVVLSGLIGLLFRAKFGKKGEDEDDIFARDFRRESVMLPDQDDYDEMSQVSGGSRSNHAQRDLARSDTLASGGSGGPRPPTFIQRHMEYATPAASQPSFQPGQLVNSNTYFGHNGFPRGDEHSAGDAGGWGVAAGYANRAPQSQDGYSDGSLSRQGTQRSGYEQSQQRHDPFNALPGVSEEEEELPSRSGTPVDPNPQSAYYAHGSRNGSTDQNTSPAFDRKVVHKGSRMSVRNGGTHDDRDAMDAYGGI